MKTQSRDTSPLAESIQVSLLQRASIPERMALVTSLTSTAIALAKSAIKRTNPNKSQQELNFIFVEVHYGKELAERVRGVHPEAQMSSQNVLAALALLIESFEKHNISYQIGSSLTSSAYGIARMTLDADIVADLTVAHADILASDLQNAFYVDREMILEAIEQQACFNIVHLDSMFKIDVFVLKKRKYDQESFSRRKKHALADEARKFFISTAEDVILNKLEWYEMGGNISERQWHDIIGVLKVQKEQLDMAYMERWAMYLGVSNLLKRALAEAGIK